MSDRAALIAQLIDHEGEILHAYPDSLGYTTIGVGHCIDARVGGAIPQSVSRVLLDLALDDVLADLSAHFDWFDGLDPVRWRAVADLRYNLGPNRFRGFKLFLAAMWRGDYEDAANELVDSQWYGQVGRRGPRIVHMVRTGTEV
jgi:lysozyme